MTETIQKSELEILLEKNSYGEGLTPEEFERAGELISNPEYSKQTCSICEGLKKNASVYHACSAIYDTNLCQGHAIYALITRK